jgi:hypothetical protein
MAIVRSQSKHLKGLAPGKAAVVTAGGIRYIERGDHVPEPAAPEAIKPKRAAKPRAKNDPKLVSAARELRDRYLEQINTTRLLTHAKYDVSRALPAPAAPASGAILMPQTVTGVARALPAPAAA